MNDVDLLPPRIARKIVEAPSSGCWVWQGKPTPGGYGQAHFVAEGKRRWLAHRLVAYLLGVPLGEHMHHECLNTMCVNPSHLKPMTASAHRQEHFKEFCVHGHPMADAYLVNRAGLGLKRACSHCLKEAQARRRAAMTPDERRFDTQRRVQRRRDQRARERVLKDQS